LSPFQQWLLSRGAKPMTAFGITVLVVSLALVTIGALVWVGASQFLGSLPGQRPQIEAAARDITARLGTLGVTKAQMQTIAGGLASAVFAGLVAVVSAASSAVSTLSVALLLALFMLFDALAIAPRLVASFPDFRAERFDRFLGGLRHWIVIMFYLNAFQAAAAVVGMIALGVPLAGLWGVLIVFLGFVPIVGFWISILPPVAMAALTGGAQAAAILFAIIMVANLIKNDVLYPRWMKQGLDLSVSVSMLSLFVWSLVLGPLGSVLSVPLTLVLQYALLSSPDTAGVACLMSANGRPPAYLEAAPAGTAARPAPA
jgi:predicted PurR-regulated permease PerM